ncbi:putative protein N(5)-glutamine methyltransferase [Paenibacillus hexagrammi]|uniref:peptide chain release factor N(5)-glutamine methyltransferase n=1 Tax=Paenibacillus hexagrammi TaxID=2908839 RepID=A0ABY3SSL6_9BACL|nr:putative protein N(5)-glutamine methyltransferase [Paenibacillus sp. YPD9-1]UJF36264.1 putative protein N(5)-glutamine methyltransferase [Paenibacillus sp. YPD9-1]
MSSNLPESNAYSIIVSKLRSAGCVYAEEEAQLLLSAAKTLEELEMRVEQRMAGYPLEHLIGWVDFCGQRIQIDPGVFVPRQRTGLLAKQASILAQNGGIVVDMCCGSGALGAVLLAEVEHIELHAVDIDPAAVKCAQRNIVLAKGFVYEGDLFEPLPARLQAQVHVLIANAPYVPTASIQLLPQEARIHEPHVALDGGGDGLDVLRRVAAAAPTWLANNGYLLVETSARQAPFAEEIFKLHGLLPTTIHSEELDATVVIGQRSM